MSNNLPQPILRPGEAEHFLSKTVPIARLVLLCLAAALTLTGCKRTIDAGQPAQTIPELGAAAPGAPTDARLGSAAKVDGPNLLSSPNAGAVVDASNAFLATLSKEQQGVAQIALTPQNAARWSNFPAAVVPRNGVYFRNLNPTQVEAALKVARLALSAEGFTRFQEVRASDDAYAKLDRGPGGGSGGPGGGSGGPGGRGGRGRGGFGGPGGGDGQGGPPAGVPDNQGGPPPGGFGGPGGRGPGRPGGFRGQGSPGGAGGGNLFGAGNYIIAFLGQPSKTAPWMLQLGGHHIAFNLLYKGNTGASTPYFVGVQPNVWKDAAGKTHAPLAPMRNALHDLVNSLSPQQLTQARLNASFSDVYVGPGRDGQFPALREGVPVSLLSAASKNLVKQAIAAWTGDSVQGAAYRNRYEAELEQTKVAYSGNTALSEQGDYVRIDGPHVWIEFECQGSDHYHTIWRDRATDYGAEFTFSGTD